MKITFLGVSGALSAKYNSNMLIEDDKCVILFDCGEDIMHSLKAAGRTPEELTDVYISHLHMDHCAGLGWLGYYTYFITQKKIKLHIHPSMVADLWSMLRPSMEKLHGKDRMMTLTDYFDVEVFKDEYRYFHIGDFSIQPHRQDHVITSLGNMFSYGIKAYGRRDNKQDSSFFITSDTCDLKLPGNLGIDGYGEDHLEGGIFTYDYIFCDCDVMNLNGIHPNYNDLKELHSDAKKNMWLYHYHDLGDDMPDAVADGFAGFVKEGQVFEL